MSREIVDHMDRPLRAGDRVRQVGYWHGGRLADVRRAGVTRGHTSGGEVLKVGSDGGSLRGLQARGERLGRLEVERGNEVRRRVVADRVGVAALESNNARDLLPERNMDVASRH